MVANSSSTRYFREDFDRGRVFVAAKPFSLNGKAHAPGQVVDKTHFSVRRLRQLYDQRTLNMQPVNYSNGHSHGDEVVTPPRQPRPAPTPMPPPVERNILEPPPPPRVEAPEPVRRRPVTRRVQRRTTNLQSM